MSSHPFSDKVFQIDDIDEFIVSIRSECVGDVLDGLSTTFYGKPGKFKYLLDNGDIVNEMLPIKNIEDEIEKYIFTTTLYENQLFIKPQDIEITIRDLSTDIFDKVMMKLADHGILEICWYKEDFMWRIKPAKMV
jgi:hypothetical protein